MRSLQFIAILPLLVACDDNTPQPITASEPEPTAGATETEAAAEPEVRPTPGQREHESPEQGALGTATEGLGLDVGADAPDTSATDLDGNQVSVASLVEQGPVMLVFYRGGWCPFCNFQIRVLTEEYEQFRSRGVTPVLVSVDQPEEGVSTRATYEIPFPVLSDPDLTMHRAFSVVHEADAAEVERLAGFGHDIEAFSGRDHHSFAVPSVFVIDGEGKVRWRHVDVAYRVRPSIEQLVGVLDGLGFVADR